MELSLRKALMVLVSMLLKILNLAVVLESVFLVSFKVHNFISSCNF